MPSGSLGMAFTQRSLEAARNELRKAARNGRFALDAAYFRLGQGRRAQLGLGFYQELVTIAAKVEKRTQA